MSQKIRWFASSPDYYPKQCLQKGRSRGIALTPFGGSSTTTTVSLKASGAQSRQPMRIEGSLPREELLFREPVTSANLLNSNCADTNGNDYRSLAANHPPFGVWWRQINHGGDRHSSGDNTPGLAPPLRQIPSFFDARSCLFAWILTREMPDVYDPFMTDIWVSQMVHPQ